MVVIDMLSKYAHFGVLLTSITTTRVVELFNSIVVRLHGLSYFIILNHNTMYEFGLLSLNEWTN